ncbi:MAG: rod-binding protein [Alphaproteobacteria bacterium]
MNPLSAISPTSASILSLPSAVEMSARLDAASRATANASADPRAKADQAARDFEAVFLSTMINQMMSSVPVNGPFGGGQGEKMFRSFLGDEYANSLAGAGGLGLAASVSAEILALQEVPQP